MGVNVQTSDYSSTLKDYQRFQSNEYSKLDVDNQCMSKGTDSLTLRSGVTPEGATCVLDVTGSTINASQTVSAKCTGLSQTSAQVTSTVKDTVSKHINKFLKQQQDNKAGWLALGFSAQIDKATTTTELATLITNTMSSKVSEVCDSTASSYIKKVVTLCGIYTNDTINLGENAISFAYMSCTTDLMVKTWQTNDTLIKFSSAAFQGQSNISKGIFSGLGMLIIGAIILVVLILLIGGGIYLLSGSGDSKKKKQSKQHQQQEQQLMMENDMGYNNYDNNY